MTRPPVVVGSPSRTAALRMVRPSVRVSTQGRHIGRIKQARNEFAVANRYAVAVLQCLRDRVAIAQTGTDQRERPVIVDCGGTRAINDDRFTAVLVGRLVTDAGQIQPVSR